MSDQKKYSDQSGREHDSMLGAQWADEEIDKAKRSSGGGGSDSKLLGLMIVVYVCASFIASIQFIVMLFGRKFADSAVGISVAIALFIALGILYFWGMMKFKKGFAVLYCCLAAGAMCLISHWLPSFSLKG